MVVVPELSLGGLGPSGPHCNRTCLLASLTRLVHVLLLLSLVCLQVPDCRSWVAYSGGTMDGVPEFT